MVQPVLNGVSLTAFVVPSKRKKTARIQIPEKDGTVKQHLGYESKQWQINGNFHSANRVANRDTINTAYLNNTTVTFVDEESVSTDVKILDFKFQNETYGTKITYSILLEEL